MSKLGSILKLGLRLTSLALKSAEDALQLQGILRDESTKDAISNAIPELTEVYQMFFFAIEFNWFEIQLDPEYGVFADVKLTVDATNVEDPNASIESFEANFDDQWNILSESVFITSSPTKAPSTFDSLSPTT
eukprot:UN23901